MSQTTYHTWDHGSGRMTLLILSAQCPLAPAKEMNLILPAACPLATVCSITSQF
ncbi:hypothetical protein PCASD_05980 [Puccinia coronata f. sp. avenae]|uniref:Uncharacterized protein n=1 Tax=Puccinia coronata f. sp. avenae TaxID=200324 RepID=A0A2N5V9Z6_9BASI|nr:hypothetical protein PCASD_05980 [Puccinia coronata f. sp. avenae]